MRQIDAQPGQVFQRARIQERLDDYVRDLKNRRYYEADGSLQADPSDDGRTVDLVIAITTGLPVTVRFDFKGGAPVPADRLKELAPLEREGSVDEDLLEDSETRIENYLRQEGYWKADVTVRREPTDTGLTIVFKVNRGRQYRVAAPTEIRGVRAVPVGEVAALVALQPGRVLRRVETQRRRRCDPGVLPPARLCGRRREVRASTKPIAPRTADARAGTGLRARRDRHHRRVAIDGRRRPDPGSHGDPGRRAAAARQDRCWRCVFRAAHRRCAGRARRSNTSTAGLPAVAVNVALSASTDHTRVDLTFTIQEGPAEHRRSHPHRRQRAHQAGRHPARAAVQARAAARPAGSVREPAAAERARTVSPRADHRADARQRQRARRARDRRGSAGDVDRLRRRRRGVHDAARDRSRRAG